MLDWFKPSDLPGSAPVRITNSDISTFTSLWKAAKVVETDCLLSGRRPGWEAVGMRGNIGVFLWATHSNINKQITGDLDGSRLVLGGSFANRSHSQ